MPRGTLILASHKRFDEVLTVGYNTRLATILGLELDKHVVLQGYKDDPDRLMGIAAPLSSVQDLSSLQSIIHKAFGQCEMHSGNPMPSEELHALAIVNAFNPEMVERVATAAQREGWVQGASALGRVLYLTGQARDTGLEAANTINMPVACVGHRAAEEWGIRHLAQELKQAYPTMIVSEIYEDEEPPNRKPASTEAKTPPDDQHPSAN